MKTRSEDARRGRSKPRGERPSPPRPQPQPQQRRALSQQGGAVLRECGGAAAEPLASALEANASDAERVTHGFHSYPARMHPGIARALVASFSRAGERVLDPFCGSGTVLVEAMLAARAAVGVDLSPLALRIAEVHCELRDEAALERFGALVGRVVEASLERVRSRARVRARPPAQVRALYGPHVVLELVGLLEEIRQVELEADRRALEVLFSSILVKFSQKRADSSQALADKRIRKGLCSEFFARKGGELVGRWRELAQTAPKNAVRPTLVLGDARALPQLLAEQKRFDLVVSSPPYGGTYDYHAHHELRYVWLGLDARGLERGELGARRRLSDKSGAAAAWDRELSTCLQAIAQVCKPSARIALLCGDAEVGGRRMDASAQLGRLAKSAGLELVASVAQVRPDFRGGSERREHLVLLGKA